jgi:hypothetical protein
VVLITGILFLLGCSSGGNSITAPEGIPSEIKEPNVVASHYLWGYWQGVIDPQAETLELLRLREGNFHLNALGFLEPPPLVNLTLEYLEFNGNLVTADIGLRHPFLGLTEFTGFDACGIFISNGTISGFNDPDLIMAGEGDTRMLNPDGYSRWWNPTEFPSDGTVFGYIDGLLGTPDSIAQYNSTVNGYKYFCDDLTNPDDPLDKVTLEKRGMFSAGQKNIRRYELEIGDDGLVFNYAVDACWAFPNGEFPWKAPDDFPPEANRFEPWRVSVVEFENTLFNDSIEYGGDLLLLIDVYDWFNADQNTVRVESPNNFGMIESTQIVGGGEGYSTYKIDIFDATPGPGSIDLLISVISEQEDFQDFIPGINTTSYFTYSAQVSGIVPIGLYIEWLDTVEMLSVSTPGDPHDDEISPCVAQENDGELKAFWYGYAPHNYGTYWNYFSSDIGSYSYNGLNWYGNKDTFGTVSSGPGFHRNDQAKIAPHQNGSCAAISGVFSGQYMTLFDTDRVIKSWPPYLFAWIPNYSHNIEVMTDNNGYIYGISDGGGMLRGSKTTSPNVAVGKTTYVINSGNDNRLSHVRSWGCDANNILWLTYGKTTLNGMYMAYGNDADNTSWTSGYVVYQDAAYDDIRDPSLHLVNGVFHISFLRHDTSSGDYELCYTYGDTTAGFSTPVVIDTSSTPIEDAHLQFGNYLGYDILGVAYMKETAIYFSFSYDDGDTWQPPESVQALEEPAEDPDMIFINHIGSLTEDVIVIWVQGGGSQNDCYTRMGHFIED